MEVLVEKDMRIVVKMDEKWDRRNGIEERNLS